MRGDTLKGVQRPSPYLTRRRQSGKGRRPGIHYRRLVMEPLEDRRLLSLGVEVGSAVFRDGVLGGLEWHAGLYWMYDGYTQENMVIQARGPYQNVLYDTWNDFLDGNTYKGSRELTGVPASNAQRQQLAYEGLWQVYAPYTVFSDSYYGNTGWQTGDGLFRCDTLVQYVYQEVFGTDFDGWGGFQTPHAMFNASNASPVTPIAPTVSQVEFSGQANGSITIDFSELMSRGTLDPSSIQSISLIGSVHRQYALSSTNTTFESDRIHGRGDVFAYFDSTQHLYQSADRATIHPQGGFVPGETLTLSISTDAKDLGGNSLQTGFSATLNVHAA